jgi:hypothetical protein
MARSLVQGLGDDCGAGAALAECLEAGTVALARGAGIGGIGPASICRAAQDFTARGWLAEDLAGWRRTPEPLPAGLAAFLAGAKAMWAANASRIDAVALAVVTLPAAPSTIAAALPAQGPIHASLGRTEDVLGGIARAAITSFTVMSPFVNHAGARFAIQLFEQCSAPRRTLITRRAGTTKAAIDILMPTLNAMGVRVLNYLLPAGDGYETFHAKVVLADSDQAYVGSANMTKYARHSMELGVVLRGRQARAVASIVRAVEKISSPIGLR